MDLSITQGWLVGVIKEGDPMGNKDKWFVDNGGEDWKMNALVRLIDSMIDSLSN